MNFAIIDYIFFAVILVCVIIAVVKGFVEEIFGKASWILGILAAFFFYKKLAIVLNEKLQKYTLCEILAFLILFIGVFLIVKIIETIFKKIVSISVLKSLDKALGLIFGIVEGFAFIALILFLLNWQPFFDVTPITKDSWFSELLNKFYASPEFKELTSNV